MTAHHQVDRATPRRPAAAPADLVASTREPEARGLPSRQIENRKSIVYSLCTPTTRNSLPIAALVGRWPSRGSTRRPCGR
jgi:hypothetical protein